MTEHNTMEEVWRILEEASGYPRERFSLERIEGGWLMRWADRASTPIGMTPWVVTDGGEALCIGSPILLESVLADVARARTP